MSGTFRSLRHHNYRVWAAGAIVSNVGTWMQRTAQDWLVLAELTNHKASAVGIVIGLQFAPQLLLLPFTGYAADNFDRRKLLLVTQVAMGLLALGLGLLVVTGAVRLWIVDVFAFLLGCAAAFDAPARQTFVSELVHEEDLGNAVALNSTSFNAGRLIGPAVAGILIAAVGSGPVFLINAASYVAVIGSLMLIRRTEIRATDRGSGARGGIADGWRYVIGRPDLVASMVIMFLIGTFGFNFAIYISTMSLKIFHRGADGYGFLTSVMAVGSIIGALLSAGRDRPQWNFVMLGLGVFGVGCGLAAISNNYLLYGLILAIVGIASQTVTTSIVGLVQLGSDPLMRGRVMALLMAISLGGTPLGSPIVGWIADHFGPRWAMGVGASAGIGALIVGLLYLRTAARTRAVESLEALR
ncbi:MFS transporter [Sphingomonas sp. MMS24-J13]|uniref:MFS transporter n=1 Tax=Sphingomonas sp. MMS24-J13 TaxID=3238686 RepID=UPI00384F8E71